MNEYCKKCKYGVIADYDEIIVDGMVLRRKHNDGSKGIKCTANSLEIDFDIAGGDVVCALFAPKDENIN